MTVNSSKGIVQGDVVAHTARRRCAPKSNTVPGEIGGPPRLVAPTSAHPVTAHNEAGEQETCVVVEEARCEQTRSSAAIAWADVEQLSNLVEQDGATRRTRSERAKTTRVGTFRARASTSYRACSSLHHPELLRLRRDWLRASTLRALICLARRCSAVNTQTT